MICRINIILKGVEGTGHGIRERTIRFPFDTVDTSIVKEELNKFKVSTRARELEAFVTANVILVSNNEATYR